jgi:hypothetical protein
MPKDASLEQTNFLTPLFQIVRLQQTNFLKVLVLLTAYKAEIDVK